MPLPVLARREQVAFTFLVGVTFPIWIRCMCGELTARSLFMLPATISPRPGDLPQHFFRAVQSANLLFNVDVKFEKVYIHSYGGV